MRSKKKIRIVINNKSKGWYGSSDFKGQKPTGKIEINKKAHYKKGKLDKAELASTIKHEMLHVKNPNMTERTIYKRSAKTKISLTEQNALLAKLRMKKLNYKGGVMKRKLQLKGSLKAGDMISKMNEIKRSSINTNKSIPTKRLAILGLV